MDIKCDECLKLLEKNVKFDKNIDEKCYRDIFAEKLCNQCKIWKKSLFLVICLKIGTDTPNPEYFPHLNYLLNSKYSIGILGFLIKF